MNNLFPHINYSFNNQDLFLGLSKITCDILNYNKEMLYYKSGEEIFMEGDLPKGVYRVKTGKIKKLTASSFGKTHIFYICRENEYLGYHTVLSNETYPDSAIALTDAKIELIPKNDFLKAVDNSHLLSQRLLKNLSHEFGVFLNATKILAKHTVRERTALNLLILEGKFMGSNKKNKGIEVAREDLANMVGTAKESLVRMLKDFKEEELIYTKGRSIFIKNYTGLIEVSNINK